MKKILIPLTFLLAGFFTKAQTSTPLNIDSCYTWAKQQYPQIKQKGLIERTREYTVSNASKGYYPQFSFNGQGTYQQPVLSIPLDFHLPGFNFTFPSFTAYQYNLHGEVDQTIYDGGVIKQQKNVDQANFDVQQQSLEVQLYTLKDRINQIFFGAMLINEELKQNALQQSDLQSSIDQVQAQVNNGMALQSSVDELQAELLTQQQQEITYRTSRTAYIQMLSLFINKPLIDSVTLDAPDVPLSDSIKRPELSLYDFQKKSDVAQMQAINAGNRPRFSFFFQGGYALPGLNEFNPNAALYYITGLRLSWNLDGFYTQKNQKLILNLDEQNIESQRETFLFNTNLTMKQQNQDIADMQQLISTDQNIVDKRTSVTQVYKAQLKGGTATLHDYITELDSENEARQQMLLHKVQLLMDEYEYKNTTGN
jgi:outer membrane protein TolC